MVYFWQSILSVHSSQASCRECEMNKKTINPILWGILSVILVSMACNFSISSDSEDEGPLPVETLEDARGAVIQIEAQGTFVDPQFGEYIGAGRGTGFIIDPSGIAVTNNHVVTGAAFVKVWIGGDTSQVYNARILGVSECSDLAVIDIEGEGFPYLEWYSGPVTVGLEVYAAGFPLGETEYTLTKGIVSKDSASGLTNWSSVESVIMHDATINPGNSGGPLITDDGKVVAVNYRLRPDYNQYFAIAREEALMVIQQLRAGDNVDSIGVNGSAVVSDDGTFSGIWVTSVETGSPAANAGLQGGDIITALEGQPLAADGTLYTYCEIIRSHTQDDVVALEVLRYPTGEYLEGELNGQALVVTGGSQAAEGGQKSGEEDVYAEPPLGGETGGDADPPAYYVENFDPEGTTVNQWGWYLAKGNEADFDIYTEDGKLVFDINGTDLYSYFFYEPWLYTNVRLDVKAENRGKNNNNVSLICRASDEGWYEFSIANNGLWWIYAFDYDRYTEIASGGSTMVNMGKGINEYTIMCYDTTLALYINGQETHTMSETQFSFREGQVGIGVSSFNVLPIIVEFDYVSISENMQ